ncbi:SHOCT domain-containing protein [Specibacter cremeus]|uniref:SHOCT domain-containing protein n=1 Tax=Specibacter cremeus TaxID=1629051 RepID=UPI000F783A49|nr:SHOCT domain-containing protein [Specibacter cremeus]
MIYVNFLETLWSIIVFFLFLSYLILLFQIVADIFRDSTLMGWAKAIWLLFLIVIPVLTALVYLIVRGASMAARSARVAANAEQQAEQYVRRLAANQSPAEQIASARALLDQGAITEAEYATLKAKAMA